MGPRPGPEAAALKSPRGERSKSGHLAAKRTDDPAEAASLQWALRLAGPCIERPHLGPLVDAHEEEARALIRPKIHEAIRFHGPSSRALK